jgi:hypothetical protein
MSEIGENLVGCYLRFILGCEIVVYNQKIFKQGEIDVFGIDLDKKIIYICEVNTHIKGAGYGDTIKKIRNKFAIDIKYSKNIMVEFDKFFMLWAPNVPSGLVKLLEAYKNDIEKDGVKFDLLINQRYASCVEELSILARKDSRNTGEPFYRALQILGHLKK